MATVAYTKSLSYPHKGLCHAWKWVITGSDDGQPVVCPHLRYKTVQFYGTLGGGTVSFQGALDADTPTYDALTDRAGTALTALNAATIREVRENACLVRPVCASVTSVTIWLLAWGPIAQTAS